MLATAAGVLEAAPANDEGVSIKMGEVTPTTAIIWIRSKRPVRVVTVGERRPPWRRALASNDYTLRWVLTRLEPGREVRFRVEAKRQAPVEGHFRTAPLPSEPADALFTMLSCQMYKHRDDPARGFKIYDSIRALSPSALFSCGDNVYYDNEEPVVTSVELARLHWHRMYSLPSIAECLRSVPGYWQKDDHDVYDDDSWPGKTSAKMGGFTFAEGQRIFREQVPMPDPAYRTVRWGSHVEFFLLEGRDYRSANTAPDSKSKSILGADQKEWLQTTIAESNATFKIVISPTPWVGPDRKTKNDNYSNAAFAAEGAEMRAWLAKALGSRGAVLCGDRHWQYHSVDPKTGLQEFGCGPASDEHASGTPGEDKSLHRFHRVKGGFLKLQVTAGRFTLTHCDVKGAPVYSAALTA
jgi:alkaline phosphatase D